MEMKRLSYPMLEEIIDKLSRHLFLLLHLRNQWLDDILSKIGHCRHRYVLVKTVNVTNDQREAHT